MPCFYLTPKQDDFNQELQSVSSKPCTMWIRLRQTQGLTQKEFAREWVAVIKSGAEMIGQLRSLQANTLRRTVNRIRQVPECITIR